MVGFRIKNGIRMISWMESVGKNYLAVASFSFL